MSDFTITDGVATITDDRLFTTWYDRPDYVDALAASPDPEIASRKRLVLDFEVALSRVVETGRIDEEIDALLEHFLAEEYIQHDPAVGNGRAPLAAKFREGVPPGPAPVAVVAEGDLVTLLLKLPPNPAAPNGGPEAFIPTIFRVHDGMIVEHWGPPNSDKRS